MPAAGGQTGLFGFAPSAFGTTQPAPAALWSLPGTTPAAAAPFAPPPTPSAWPGAQPSAAGAAAEVAAIQAALTCNDANPAYRFRALLLNIVPDDRQRQLRPAGVDELAWREALADAGGEGTDNLHPVAARGFEDLCSRYQEQSNALASQEQCLATLEAEAAAAQRRRGADLTARLGVLRERHAEQCHALLRASRVAEALDARAAPWAPDPLREEEEALRLRLARLQHSLPALRAKAEALRAAARGRECTALAAAQAQAGRGGGGGRQALSAEAVERVAAMLQEQAVAIKALGEVLKRDARDVGILEEAGKEAPAPASPGLFSPR